MASTYFKVNLQGHAPTWQEREAARMKASYAPVPWSREPWAQDLAGEHFPHLSMKQPDLIAYTPDAKKGAADIQTAIKAGRYLQRYYSTVLTPDQISSWAARCKSTTVPLIITKDAPTIESVYRTTTGGSACMSYPTGHYHTGGVHPTALYARSPDLSLGYIHHRGDPHQEIVARSILWPARKIATRIYGDEKLMLSVLATHGYHQDLIIGAQFPAIWSRDILAHHMPPGFTPTNERFILPFIDHIHWAQHIRGQGAIADHFLLTNDPTLATHSCQHADAIAYPISSAPPRAFGIRSVQVDYIKQYHKATNEVPKNYPCGHPILRDTLAYAFPSAPPTTNLVTNTERARRYILQPIAPPPARNRGLERATTIPQDQMIDYYRNLEAAIDLIGLENERTPETVDTERHVP